MYPRPITTANNSASNHTSDLKQDNFHTTPQFFTAINITTYAQSALPESDTLYRDRQLSSNHSFMQKGHSRSLYYPHQDTQLLKVTEMIEEKDHDVGEVATADIDDGEVVVVVVVVVGG